VTLDLVAGTKHQRTKLAGRLNINLRTLQRHAARHKLLCSGTWTVLKRPLGRPAISDHTIERVISFLQRPGISTISPFKKHTLKVRVQGFSEHVKWHFLDKPLPVVWAQYIKAGEPYMCLRNFFSVCSKLKWLKRRRLQAQRLICACNYHYEFKCSVSALNRLSCQEDTPCLLARKKHTLESLWSTMYCADCDPLLGIGLKCVEGRCSECGWKNLKDTVCPHDQPGAITWSQFEQVPVITKKGHTRKITQLVQKSASVPLFLEHLTKQGKVFGEHHWKGVFLGEQRHLLWDAPPPIHWYVRWTGPMTIPESSLWNSHARVVQPPWHVLLVQ
jgi:hypothetical protein